MIKAVFFDLYHTLVTYDPPQEELQAGALKELGVDVQPAVLRGPIVAADEFIYNEIARRPLSHRSREEKLALYMQYQETVLREAAVPYDTKLVMGLLGKMQQTQMNLVLFDDVAPTLTELKKRGLTMGLISNIEQDIDETLNRLGLPSWLEIVVTSQDAGANKPQPETRGGVIYRRPIPGRCPRCQWRWHEGHPSRPQRPLSENQRLPQNTKSHRGIGTVTIAYCC